MISFLKQVASEFSADDCPRMAAALAYYTTFSLAPLLILITMLASFFLDPADVEGQLEQQASSVLGGDGATQVKEMLHSASRPDSLGVAGVFGVVGLILGASGVMGQLQRALNDAWEVKPDPKQGGIWNFITKRLFSAAMVLGLGFILVVSLAISTMIAALDQQLISILPGEVGEGAAKLIDLAMTLVVLSLLFAAIFKVLPDAEVHWRDVLVGALVTAVLFVIGKFALGMYLGSKNMESTFGAAGSLALILVWVYYSSMILLMGAEFTQVWAKRRGRGLQPEEGAVRVQKKEERVSPAPG